MTRAMLAVMAVAAVWPIGQYVVEALSNIRLMETLHAAGGTAAVN